MDIIQEAKEVLKNWKEGLIRPTEHNNDASMDLISRLVDRLEWKDMESCPIGETVLAIDADGEIVAIELDINRRAEIVVLGDVTNDYPALSYWLPLPPVGDKQK